MKSVEEMEMKVEGMRKVMGGDKGGGGRGRDAF